MAVYFCAWCDRYVDDDWYPCEEIDGELVCPRCVEEKETPDEEIHRINKELSEMKDKSLNCNKGSKLWISLTD